MRLRSTRFTLRRVRWTRFELCLIAFAVLLMAGSATAEVYRWANPPVAPAAPRADEASPTATDIPPIATDIPPTATEALPTATDVLPTATNVLPTATDIPPTVVPTEQSTVLPTEQPSVTPFPTVVVRDPPLTLEKWASVETIKAGEQFTFVVVVRSSSEESRAIEVRDSIDQQLDVLEAGSDNGPCTAGATVVCTVTVSNTTLARIIINVRVRPDVPPGASLASQALARDDLRSTASSDRVVVSVVGAATQGAVVPTPTPTVAPTNQQPASKPESEAVIAAQQATDLPTAMPSAGEQTTTQATQLASPSPQPTQPAAPVSATLTPSTGSTRPNPALPPTLVPGTTSTEPRPATPAPSPNLPSTAAATSSFGLGVGLLGLAMTIHGARRVRRADKRLSAAGAAVGELGPLVTHAFEYQHATAEEIERMRRQGDEMLKLTKKSE